MRWVQVDAAQQHRTEQSQPAPTFILTCADAAYLQAARVLCNRLRKQSLKYHGTYRRTPAFFATFALQVHVESKHKHQ